VAKGGNLLLNVAPSPEGEWDKGAYDLLQAYGDWMKVNSTAIYNTKPIEPYKEENICFTQNKVGNVFAFYLAKDGEDKIPAEIIVKSISPKKETKITMLGSKTSLKWTKEGGGFKVVIPESLRNNLPCKEAWTLKVEAINR
jgi:alpha-L-fucosidase